MKIIKSIKDWQKFSSGGIFRRKSLGFVPTMGALHDGHLSLIGRSRLENDYTLASIFVNPTQFNDPADLKKYPRTLEGDIVRLKSAGTDYLLLPRYEEIYCDGYSYKITENTISAMLCGASRPGHFTGVLTVIMKLLQIAGADNAYFGEKDYQQYLLVKGTAEAFFLKTHIIPCPTVREKDGLAMSSRNLLLTRKQRKLAAAFPRILLASKKPGEALRELKKLGFKVDYIEDRWNRRFGAVKLGKVRLIDNVRL